MRLALAQASARFFNMSIADIDLQGDLAAGSVTAATVTDFSEYDRAAVDALRAWGGAASGSVVEEAVRMGAQALAMAQDVLRQVSDVRALQVLSASQRASLELLGGPGADGDLTSCAALNMSSLVQEARGATAGADGKDADGIESWRLSKAANEQLYEYLTTMYIPHLRTQRAVAAYALLNVRSHATTCCAVCAQTRMRPSDAFASTGTPQHCPPLACANQYMCWMTDQ